ncbi:MAG: response regulator transcription factor [Chloroflexota bacterium]
MISIFLADDHAIIRRFIKRLLEEEADLSVIGEAANGIDAVKLVAELKPDILITDLSMPGLDGIEVTRRVRKASPQTLIVALSNWDAQKNVVAAKQAGASAYVVKNLAVGELVHTVRMVMDSQADHYHN